MLQYVIAGLVLGGIYAIASAGLVITYVSSGILNFAFGALAFFVARFYYYLHVQQNWGIARRRRGRDRGRRPGPRRRSVLRAVPLPAALLAAGQGGGHARAARSPSPPSPR